MNEIDGLIAPTIDSSVGAFHCPHCGAFAQQLVVKLGAVPQEPTIYSGASMTSIKEMIIRECCVCNGLCFFRKNGSLVYPTTDAGIPLPHKDMPRGIQRHYLEARLIAAASPRGAGAIIRLALQMLCQEMTGSKSSINNMIGALRETGVPDRVIKAMDILRVTGNDAVHAGEMNLDEDSSSVRSLFILMNLIVDELIAKPKEIEALYMNLPSGARAAIDIRDHSK